MLTAKTIQSAVDCELCVIKLFLFVIFLSHRLVPGAVVREHLAFYWQQIANGQHGRPEDV